MPSHQTSKASIILPIFLLFIPLLSSSLSPLPHSSDLIQKTCNSTTYYDFCMSSLSSFPQTNPNTTIKTLSTTIIDLAISNATNTSSFISSLSKSTTNPSLSSLLRMCAEKYIHAKEALQSSLVAMEDKEYDYAFMHVSAAAEYPNVCRVLFRRSGGGVVYPVEVGRKEEVLERLCTVALDIISLLG